MGKYKKLIFKIIAIIFTVILIAYSIKQLYSYVDYKLEDYYAGWYHSYESKTIEEAKMRGSYLWEYDVDSVIKVDTFIIRLNGAFAERAWYHNRKNPDSIIVDSFYWQVVISVPQIKECFADSLMLHYLWDLEQDKMQSKRYSDSSVIFRYMNRLKKVPPQDTIKYYFFYNFRDNTINGNGFRQYDTLTLYMTRKNEEKEQNNNK